MLVPDNAVQRADRRARAEGSSKLRDPDVQRGGDFLDTQNRGLGPNVLDENDCGLLDFLLVTAGADKISSSIFRGSFVGRGRRNAGSDTQEENAPGMMPRSARCGPQSWFTRR
jgi:hypothetical protein